MAKVQKPASMFWRNLFRPDGFLRQEMLTIYLMLVGVTTFFGYVSTPVERVSQANLVVSVLAVCLLMVVRVRALFELIVHTIMALLVMLIVFTATQTGGINSTSVVWLSVFSVAVLLLLGRVATLIWIAIMLCCIWGLTLATWMGWISSHVNNASTSFIGWAWLNHLLALMNLMMAVRIYEHLQQVQLRKLNQRNNEIKATHQALIQAQAHKDEFVAAVGHELRTPMNAILGFNGVLRRELEDDPEQLAVVGHIRRSTEHLLQVVNDILDFSQLQAGKLHLNPVDYEVRALTDELQQRHGEKARSKGVALCIHCDPVLPLRLQGDRNRLLQILNNLVDNAIKFTAEGVVDVKLIAQGEWLRLEVRDAGRGIALERQQHIFRRFEHADVQTNRTYGGTGLGLTLCEKLVSLHGGKIGVVSQPGHGALFWLEIPLQAAQDQSPEDLRDDELADEALNILVVDDNRVNLMVAQLQLQKCWPKAKITTVDSGAKALPLLDAQVFDVALVDMIMPVMDGMQLTQHIRQFFPAIAARMPILALTANTNPVDREKCLAAGMNDVLHKPMDEAVLMRTVAHQVRLAREARL
ncbi:hybrid sensor histidine kinase/response regulator [Limnohabitans sp.]|jgi:signal transduction histidine kinase/CheY-like chemotaxis protein|uniref:hybrid sensor histidine kinase/response regulator n=1 Tax=Limnohabitans sp. TaxID=1907725 RepID=UPI0037C13E83